jgi:hypothetical protein
MDLTDSDSGPNISSNTLTSCSVGLSLNEECNKTSYTRKIGLRSLDSLTDDEKELLFMRTSISSENPETFTICHHHEKKYISSYVSLQMYCIDPMGRHKVKIKGNIIFFIDLCVHDKYYL